MPRNSLINSLIILTVSLCFGIAFWIIDSYYEFLFFHQNLSFMLLEGPENFFESLILKVPPHSLFFRVSFVVASLIGGVLVAVFFHIKVKSDAALRVSEERYRKIFETARDAIVLCNRNTYAIIDANGIALKLYGYSRNEMLELKFTDIVSETRVLPFFSQDSRNCLSVQHHRRKNNEIFPVEISVSDDHSSEQNLQTVVIRDISERIKAEQAKQLLETRLFQAQKMEALGTLAGGVAHDLNNILSGLVGYPDLLMHDLPEGSPLYKPLMAIKNSGKKAADIVQDLLTLARRNVTTAQTVDLNSIIAEYFQSLEFQKFQTMYPEISIEMQLEKQLPPVTGSPVHLSKSIMNLVVNAMEAILGPGSITISTKSISLEQPLIGYEPIKAGNYVRFRIADTGIGISATDLPRIFEPFYSKKVMGKSGTGLGMAVVWGTVKDHDGFIDIRSVLQEGTTIDLYFPVGEEQQDVLGGDPDPGSYMGSESILVVDDLEDQREIISHMLTRLGYAVTTVESGEAALSILKRQAFDLVILDMIMMPGMDGLTTLQLIRQTLPHQKAIISSGFSDTNNVQEALRIGAGAFIKKPYVLNELGKAVRIELDKTAK